METQAQRGQGSDGPRLLLASASPRRRELLAALGLRYEVAAADVDEALLEHERPEAAALRLARLKAETAAAPPAAGTLVIGADTVVALDGRILAKPGDAAEATAMLRDLRGRAHYVITGLAVVEAGSGRVAQAAPCTDVVMRAYTDAEIAASIAAGTPFDKAGGYAIQDPALAPVAEFRGCYCNVVGLPLWTLRRLLLSLTPELAADTPDRARTVCAGCPEQRDPERRD